MGRFARIDNEPVYSELKPERCPRHGAALTDERAREKARRAFMDDYPEAQIELRADEALYSQGRRRSR